MVLLLSVVVVMVVLLLLLQLSALHVSKHHLAATSASRDGHCLAHAA